MFQENAANEAANAANDTGLDISKVIDIAWPIVTSIFLAIVILIIGWKASKWAHKLVLEALRKAKFDEPLARFLGSIVQYIVIAMTIIATLGQVGIETTSIIAILASAGLAVGLALQGSLANFSSGVMLLFFRPFQLGDKVTIAGQTGDVEDIGLFASKLITINNQTVIIPNSQITSDKIVNITQKGIQRGEIDVGVAYGADLKQVQAALLNAAKSVEEVLADPAPGIAFVSLGASSLDFKVLAWCKSPDYLTMLHNVRCAVYDELNSQDIEIPFSQIVVHQAPKEEPTSKKAA